MLSRISGPELDEERFAVQRDLLLKEYANFFKGQAYSYARYAASHLLELSRWHILEYVDYIGSAACTHAALVEFGRKALLERVHIVTLCHGNAGPDEALKLVEEAAEALGSRPLARSQLPTPRLLQLPTGTEVVLRTHPSLCSEAHQALLNTEERNSAIELTLQAGIDERPATLMVELLAQMLALAAYEQLRTSEQLGYIVNLGMRYDLGVIGLRVIVQSAAHDAAYLDERIEAFLATVPSLIANLTAAEFENHRASLLSAKMELHKTLRQESAAYWHEITQGTYDFGRDAKDAEVLRTLTKQHLAEYWAATFDAAAPARRKLSAQAFAAHHSLPAKLEKGVHGRPVHYVDGLDAAIEYKRTLAAFPAPLRCS